MSGPAEMTGSAEEYLRRVEQVTDVGLAHLDVQNMLRELVERVRDLLAVDTAAVLLWDERSQQLVATAAAGLEEEVRQGVRIPLGQGFAGRIVVEKRPVVLDRIDRTTVWNPLLWGKGLRALLGVPLLAAGSVIGVLHVGTLAPRTFSAQDVGLLQMAADRIALAVQVRLIGVERSAAAMLQRSLLPDRLPEVPGLHFAARYVPGEGNGVGGDWYDVFPLPGDRLGIVIGDVVGHGLHAATVMGRLRNALRCYALDSMNPAEVLDRLDRQVLHFETDVMATVSYTVYDANSATAEVSTAGHLPPVLAAPDEPAVLLDLPVDPPIGAVRVSGPRRTGSTPVPAGALLCFYTDGLIERRDSPLDFGLRRLCAALDDLRAGDGGAAEDVVGVVDDGRLRMARWLDAVCSTLMTTFVGADAPEDDIALLVLGRAVVDRDQPMRLQLSAVPAMLAVIRASVRRWLAEAGADADETGDLLLAISEACTNVVEHAYGPAGGSVSIELRSTDGEIWATISDQGRWRPPRGTNRGRGTTLMQQCCDECRIESGPNGTTVVLRRRLGGTSPR